MNSLLSKVRDFLPQMAEANEKLAKEQTESSGIDIANVVESDSDSDLSADEISENAEKSEQAEERTRIEIDLSVFEEASSSEVRRSESDSSSASESDDELPEAFQKNAINDKTVSKGGHGKSSTRKLIEEIQSS
ncbi:unnamed protein product, partial [Anisakis simplex]|uniref:DUF3408 domain-containing protein n=1 Tax=Anisakis simplex TaxID=6269 RepID=A0A0M3JQ63_ANISI